MKLLVIGVSGLVGGSIAREARARGWDVTGTYHTNPPDQDFPTEKLDICSRNAIEEIIDRVQPEIVVNCAALTDVDGCEEYPDKARRVNGEAPGTIAKFTANRGIDFVHLSTDYVFDGQQNRRYEPDDEPRPIQKYGQSKLFGERTVMETHSNPLIVRLSFVYGRNWAGDIEGFPGWVLTRLRNGVSTPLFTDQYITPTRAASAAETILDLSQDDAKGIFHSASADCITPYQFGTVLAELSGEPAAPLEKSKMDDLDRIAERPKSSCLSVKKTERQLNRSQPSVTEDIRAVL